MSEFDELEMMVKDNRLNSWLLRGFQIMLAITSAPIISLMNEQADLSFSKLLTILATKHSLYQCVFVAMIISATVCLCLTYVESLDKGRLIDKIRLIKKENVSH